VDAHVATLVKAIQSRAEYLAENWLVVISTDHGGRGRKHRGGHDVPEIFTTFLVVSGSSSIQGKIEEPSYIVDVPVTALTHLGVPVDVAWQLDGKAVGIRQEFLRDH
jgi:arylsulfatase A-like enzyme